MAAALTGQVAVPALIAGSATTIRRPDERTGGHSAQERQAGSPEQEAANALLPAGAADSVARCGGDAADQHGHRRGSGTRPESARGRHRPVQPAVPRQHPGWYGGIGVPSPPHSTGRERQHRMPDRRGQRHRQPAGQLPDRHRRAGFRQAPAYPEHRKSGRRGLRQHQRPHLAGPGRDLQHLPVRGYPRCGWAGLRAGGRQSRQSGHPFGHRATRRGSRLLRPEFQFARPELWLPGSRFRRLWQLQQPLRGTWLQ